MRLDDLHSVTSARPHTPSTTYGWAALRFDCSWARQRRTQRSPQAGAPAPARAPADTTHRACYRHTPLTPAPRTHTETHTHRSGGASTHAGLTHCCPSTPQPPPHSRRSCARRRPPPACWLRNLRSAANTQKNTHGGARSAGGAHPDVVPRRDELAQPGRRRPPRSSGRGSRDGAPGRCARTSHIPPCTFMRTM